MMIFTDSVKISGVYESEIKKCRFKKMEPETIYKIVLVGDSGVGKTCLLLRFSDTDDFKDIYVSTIGVDFRSRTITVDGKTIKLQIWDTAGQERYRAITAAYYRGAHGIIFVYDITDNSSFDNMKTWMEDVNKYTKDHPMCKCLVGAKADLEEDRQVLKTQGEKLAEDNGMFFLETSSKTNTNVETTFMCLGRELLQSSLKPLLVKAPSKEPKKECCN